MSSSSSTGEQFFTPGELCDRWKVDPRTLGKLELPWVAITPRVRRVPATVVITYEQAQRLSSSSSI